MGIRVLTVEDSTLIRLIINNTIKDMDGVELVGTAENGKVALDRQRFDEGYELTVETQTRGAKVYEHIARIMTRRTGWGKFVAAL